MKPALPAVQMVELLGRFLDHLRSERRLSPHTIDSYRRDLERIMQWCAEQGVTDWTAFDEARLRRYLAMRHRSGIGGRTQARELSALRTLYRWLQRERLVVHDPAAGVGVPKSPRRLPDNYDVDRMSQLLTRDPGDDPLLIRDRALLELLYSSALRLAEAVALDIGHLDRQAGLVRVFGKGSKERIVPVGRMALAALDAWLQARGQLAAMGEQALFVGVHGRRLGPRGIQKRLTQWAEAQGLPADLHPHLLRHSCASHLLQSSGDLRAVQELLGHADIGTTQIYTHLDYQHLAQVYDQAHPRARRKRDEER